MSKTIIVTGAGSGIGQATAHAFLAAGWRVGLIGRREEALRETAGTTDALVLPCDVTDPAQVQAAFDKAAEAWGRLDCLFNNAGQGAKAAPVDEIAIDEWLGVVNVNLNGMFFCARAAFGQMRKQSPQGGRIIQNGSISAHVPRPGSAAYTATKHAVTGLTKTMGLDGRKYDIAVGQIDIGNAATQMAAAFPKGVPQADGEIRVEPVMDVKLVAEAVLNMAKLPLEVNVPFMTIMARDMPYIGRG